MAQRVLLVEDDRSWQDILTEILEDMDLTIRYAATYEAAVRALEEGPYDLALLDISLGTHHHNEEGLQVLEQLRARYPDMPALILTGYATVDLAVQTLTNLRAADFIRKEQFDRRRFQERLHHVLGTEPQTTPPPATPPAASPVEADRLEARILVVEDNKAWRTIYEELLGENGATLAMAVSYGEAQGLLRRHAFDVAVIDLKLASSTKPEANRDGLILLRLTQESQVPTIVVSALGAPEEIDRAYEEYGIFAFFDKEGFQRRAFLRTVQDAVRHRAAPDSASREPSAPAAPSDNPLAELTERQLEVLALLVQGKTNNEIAEEIVVSVNTVKKHVLAIFSVLGVNTRAAAAAVAAKYGIGK